MQYIESFKIQGLAGREDVAKQTLHKNLNVFWGLNGSGKTTLFKLLHAALQNSQRDTQNLAFIRAEVTIIGQRLLSTDSDSYQIDYTMIRKIEQSQGEINEDEEEVDTLFEPILGDDAFDASSTETSGGWASEYTHFSVKKIGQEDTEDSLRSEIISYSEYLKPRLLNRKITHTYLPITRITEGRPVPFSVRAERLAKMSADEAFSSQVKQTWQNYSVRSSGKISKIQEQGLAKVLSILFGGDNSETNDSKLEEKRGSVAVSPEQAYELIKKFMKDQQIELSMNYNEFSSAFDKSPQLQRVVNEIQEVSQRTEEVLEPQRALQKTIEMFYRGDKKFKIDKRDSPVRFRPLSSRFVIHSKEKSISLESLSSGEKQLLYMLLEILNTSNETILIDEPELSLHVDWQRQLVESMTEINDNCQILLATHSPELIGSVSPESVFEL